MSAFKDLPAGFLELLLKDLAAEGTLGEILVRGTSMRRTLLEGDRVQLVPLTGGKPRLGDLVARPGQAGPIIHRLVGWWRTPDGWHVLTKGDAAHRLDPPLHPDCLMARVVARIRDGKVRRLDDWGARCRGWVRATLSLCEGLMMEAWCRLRQKAHRQAGWPPG